MAKAKSVLFPEIRGALKGLEFRMRYNGVLELGKKRIPTNPRSDLQMQIRKQYGRLVQEWNSLSPEEKEDYNRRASALRLSGWNLYVMENFVAPTISTAELGVLELGVSELGTG